MDIPRLTPAGSTVPPNQAAARPAAVTPAAENRTGDGTGFAVRAAERLAELSTARLQPADDAPAPRSIQVNLDIDEATNRVVAKLLDRETGELVRQIPADELLRDAAGVRELLAVNVDIKA